MAAVAPPPLPRIQAAEFPTWWTSSSLLGSTEGFMNQFGGEISESMDIESLDSSVYAVKGTKYMNKMLPLCGWKEFFDAHPIEVNDSLLFQHIEKACFKVLIIDPDGCEKVFPCGGIRISSSNMQEQDTDYVDVSDGSHDRTNKLSRLPEFVKESLAVKGIVLVNVEKLQELPKNQSVRLRNQVIMPYYTCMKMISFVKCAWSSDFDDDPKTNAVHDYVLSCMSILSEEQEEQVDGLIKEIQPETTVFVAVMKPSNV